MADRRLADVQVGWLTAFLDLPADAFGEEVRFWRAITGSTVSPPRGEHREFASLEPFTGDPHLRVQRVDDGPGAMHLDIHTDDVAGVGAEAVALGATAEHDAGTHRILRSPAGFRFCLVPWEGESERARPIRWPGDAISIADQLCIDILAPVFDVEVDFWATLTGWAPSRTTARNSSISHGSPRSPWACCCNAWTPATPRRRTSTSRPARCLTRSSVTKDGVRRWSSASRVGR